MDSIDTLAAEAALELYVEAKSNHLASLDVIAKAIGLPFDADPTHTYSHRSGEYGDYRFWWTDNLGNYWQYTNAPADHVHNDPRKGEPFIVPDQPMPHTAPEFFTQEGLKRHMGVPGDVLTEVNKDYNTADPFNIWYEVYQNTETGEVQYVYLDKDVKEDPALYVSYNLRIVDSNIPHFREMLSKMFAESGTKNKTIAAILMLLDQGVFDLDSLIEASVGDLVFIGDTVKLLNRKLVCDEELFNFLVSLKAQRPEDVSLFLISTATGLQKVGRHHISAVLEYFRISPPFLQSWHCSQKYVKTYARLMAEGQFTDPTVCDKAAIEEVADALGVDEDITFLINPQVRIQVMTNFLDPQAIAEMITPQDEDEPTDKQMAEEADENAQNDAEAEEGAQPPPPPGPPVQKSLDSSAYMSDQYGVVQINSQLENYTSQEEEFSEWLHKQPLHMTGVLPEAELWGEEEETDEPTEKSLPVRVSVIRALASSDDIIQGWSKEIHKSNSKTLKSLGHVDSIFCSDLPRAVATALEIQALNPGTIITKSEDFRTANFGEYTGRPGTLAKSLVNKWEKGETLVRNGEDYQEFRARVLDRFVSIVKDAPGGSHVCIVTHELPALLTQARVLTWGTDSTMTLKSLSQAPGAVSTYEYDPNTDEFTVISLNA
jgi:broad specificity phosphatase PhoE